MLTDDEIKAIQDARTLMLSKWKQETNLVLKDFLDSQLTLLAKALDKLEG